MQLQKNKVLITGATAGIGEALLNNFLKLDNQIIAVGRNEQKLKTLAQKDQRIIPFCCDISKAEDLDKLVMFVEQEHPDMNILINNAGIQYNYNFTEEVQLLGKIEKEINVHSIIDQSPEFCSEWLQVCSYYLTQEQLGLLRSKGISVD